MSQPRFFYQFNPTEKEAEITDKEIVHQLKNVLRIKKGEKIFLIHNLYEAQAEIKEIKKNSLKVNFLNVLKHQNEHQGSLKLYCAVLKKDKFEWLTQKVAEIGVDEIIPIITKRTVKLNVNHHRLEKIAKEASEQAKRLKIPKISQVVSFNQALELAKLNDFNLAFEINGESLEKIKEINFKTVGLFIGPEGGFLNEEIKKFQQLNFFIAKISPFVLKSETAAIIASYLILNKFLIK